MTPTPVYTIAAMQARFETLRAQIAKIEATSPRIERDRIYATLIDEEKKRWKAAIKIHEDGLFEMKQELSLLARALGGKFVR